MHRPLSLAFTAAIFAAACSVINSYDDVVQAPGNEAGTSGSSGSSNQMGGNGSLAGDGSMGGLPPEIGGAGGAGTVDPGPPTTGLIVVGAKSVDGTEDLLLTLDPTDGSELSREAIAGAAVVGIAYDGAEGKNLWFIFTASDFPADPMSKSDLQVRSYDDASDEWTTVKKVTALPPPRPGSFVVLNDRLAYLSHGLVSGMLTDTVTILDTSSRMDVAQIDFTATLNGRVLGIVGSRGAPGDATALGGNLAVATGLGCNNAMGAAITCSALSLTPIFVGDDVTTGVASNLRGFWGHPAFASSATEQRAFVALPAETLAGNAEVIRFDPRDLQPEPPLAPPTPAKALTGLSIADCVDVTVFGVVADKSLWATSEQGTSVKATLLHISQDVVYEPFTSSIIAPFNPDSPLFGGSMGMGGAGPDPELVALSVGRSGITPSLQVRAATEWAPPDDVAMNVVATRFPIPFECPQ
ncbi:MAG TPA: hypothetical protein VJN18_28255 [Polyangiaceae bacterium]|nr:hypothetical protein [Polyangiaceae bacterium]